MPILALGNFSVGDQDEIRVCEFRIEDEEYFDLDCHEDLQEKNNGGEDESG